MRNDAATYGARLLRNMLVAARGYVASARVVHEAGDPADPDVESLYAVVLLCGLSAELAFKAAYVKLLGPPAAARYSIGPDLRRAAAQARDWGYAPPRPDADRMLERLADAYLAVATRRYDVPLDPMKLDAADVLSWTEDLLADVETTPALLDKYPLPTFLG